jgi:ABC-type sulfate/molybdate transport systems ATPase subunit
MSLLSVTHVIKIREGFVLNDIHFRMNKYEKVVIAGETGSGKSTLLRLIAGLEQPDSGEIIFNGEKVKGAEEQLVPGHPHIAYLSQHFELPKFLRVEQVLSYANALSSRQANEIYAVCRINELMQRKTDQLSGGEKQRIAIARLLISQPKLLLLDEPFSHLDSMLKDTLKAVVNDIGHQLRISCILVSHDPADTLSWADKIIVLKQGKIVQQGNANEIYRQPVNEYVAGLFGPFVKITPALRRALELPDERKVGLVRPEDFRITRSKEKSHWKIHDLHFYGHIAELKIRNRSLEILASTTNRSVRPGDWVKVKLTKR